MNDILFLLAGLLVFCVIATAVFVPLLKRGEAGRERNQKAIRRDPSLVAAWRILDIGALDVNVFRLEARIGTDQSWLELGVANAAKDLERSAAALGLSPALRVI